MHFIALHAQEHAIHYFTAVNMTGAVWGFIADIPDSRLVKRIIPQVIVAVTRFFSGMPEMVTLAVKRTVLRKRETLQRISTGNRMTWTVGQLMNAMARLLNRTVKHRYPVRTDFEYVLDASWKELCDGVKTMTASVSLGLLFVCGLVSHLPVLAEINEPRGLNPEASFIPRIQQARHSARPCHDVSNTNGRHCGREGLDCVAFPALLRIFA